MEVTKEFRKFITKTRSITGASKNNILNCICFTRGHAHATNLKETCSINLHTNELDGYMVFHRDLASALPNNKCLPNLIVKDCSIVVDFSCSNANSKVLSV